MSLINDALQRAKQSQPANPPAPGSNLQFRPVEPASKTKRQSGLLWPAAGAALVVAVIAVVASHSQSVKRISARERPPAPTARPAGAAANGPAGLTPSAQLSAATTNLPASAGVPSPKASPPRLQAIVFNAARPSAIINGKTVFVGNRIGDSRVSAITPTTATLVSEAETNVLTLE